MIFIENIIIYIQFLIKETNLKKILFYLLSALIMKLAFIPISYTDQYFFVKDNLFKFSPGNQIGSIEYYNSNTDKLRFTLNLKGLRPNSEYMLMLNGKPGKAGNNALESIGKVFDTGLTKEGYVDFSIIRTDKNGSFHKQLETPTLPEGYYDVKLFVKDISNNYRVILGLNDLRFTINPPISEGQLQISITRIVPNDFIEGIVKGISQEEYKKYKVIVYIRTDKWHIHPFSEGGEGFSFATIKLDGSWRIRTVKRDFPADSVVALLVDASYPSPSSLRDISDISSKASDKIRGKGRL